VDATGFVGNVVRGEIDIFPLHGRFQSYLKVAIIPQSRGRLDRLNFYRAYLKVGYHVGILPGGLSMPQIGNWIKKAVKQVLDPDRDERIQEVATLLHQSLHTARDKFSIQVFSDQVGCTDRDLQAAKIKVYRTILDRAWQDDVITPNEQKTLAWVAQRLAIEPKQIKSIQHEIARERFANAFSQAMYDGVIDDAEAKHLEQIAKSIGLQLGDFVRAYFHTEGERFLRGVFTACIEGGALSQQAWTNLLLTSQRLGLTKSDLLSAIRPQAERFVEHVLADAKSDGVLTQEEDAHLMQLVRLFELPSDTSAYILKSISGLRAIRLIGEGKLPTLSPPVGIAIRAGEIVHLHSPAVWMQKRVLKSGERWDQHVGNLTITDNRLLFSTDTKSFDVRFGRIVSHTGSTGEIRLQRMEKPEGVIRVNEDEPVTYAILDAAIAFASQTRLTKLDDASSRHIPREVRQRVWQRYGGRCAECSAAQYLEFDHIVPVAKGGSNSDANVQLLCRNCNLKKSDRI
jgi:tellurite resistance protein